MHTLEEKKNFAQRLQASLANAKPPVTMVSELTREFSLRHKGGTVTPGAVRKWWYGEAIPADDKLDTLAAWLKVPKHWLRYGEAPKSKKGEEATIATTAQEVMLLEQWRGLSAQKRKVLMLLLAELAE